MSLQSERDVNLFNFNSPALKGKTFDGQGRQSVNSKNQTNPHSYNFTLTKDIGKEKPYHREKLILSKKS